MSYRFIPQLDDADIRRQQQEGLANTLARVWNSPSTAASSAPVD